MITLSYFVLASVIISLQLVVVETIYHCYAFGNSHLVRFPVNKQEKDHVHDVWCKKTGVRWLIWNKYAAVSIRIGRQSFSITDFNIVIYHDDGNIALTLNPNQFEVTPLYANAGINMNYSKWEDGFSFSYINAEFTVIVTRSQFSSGQYHYNIDIAQSMCLIKNSDGLCKTGCTPMTSNSVWRRRTWTNKTSLEEQIVQKAVNICDIYINNFIRQIPNSLTQIEIKNARHSCIIDVTQTGDTLAARAIVDLMAVQIASSNAISTRDLAIKLENNMAQIAMAARDSFVQSTSEVQQILDSLINSTVLFWSENGDCENSTMTYPSYPYLAIYARSSISEWCGAIYARSLLALKEINNIPTDREVVLSSLTLFYAQHNEFEQNVNSGDVLVQRIKSHWSSQTTKRTQVEITTTNQAKIPARSSKDEESVTIDITKLVQDMRKYDEVNYGVQLTLKIERPDQSMIFCSPSHPDINRRPKVSWITRAN